eukprot:SAG31_NODE_839_length_11600_cov_3.351013_1_plen_89_part_00
MVGAHCFCFVFGCFFFKKKPPGVPGGDLCPNGTNLRAGTKFKFSTIRARESVSFSKNPSLVQPYLGTNGTYPVPVLERGCTFKSRILI